MPKSETHHGNPHQLLKHIEFPYYNEKALSRHQIINELEHFIEALCRAEAYITEKPNNTVVQFKETGPELDIAMIDWESFNISNYDIQQTEQPIFSIDITQSSTTPIHISISSLWNILRLQQICESRKNMIDILKCIEKEREFYQVIDNDSILAVSKSFDWDNDDNVSIKTCCSQEDW